MPHTRYHGGTSFIVLKAASCEPVAANNASTIRVRNQTGHPMTLIGFSAYCTLSGNTGTVDLQNAAAASHLAAAIALVNGTVVATTTFTGAAGNFKLNNTDFYVVFNNPAGVANITDAQASITCDVQWAST